MIIFTGSISFILIIFSFANFSSLKLARADFQSIPFPLSETEIQEHLNSFCAEKLVKDESCQSAQEACKTVYVNCLHDEGFNSSSFGKCEVKPELFPYRDNAQVACQGAPDMKVTIAVNAEKMTTKICGDIQILINDEQCAPLQANCESEVKTSLGDEIKKAMLKGECDFSNSGHLLECEASTYEQIKGDVAAKHFEQIKTECEANKQSQKNAVASGDTGASTQNGIDDNTAMGSGCSLSGSTASNGFSFLYWILLSVPLMRLRRAHS